MRTYNFFFILIFLTTSPMIAKYRYQKQAALKQSTTKQSMIEQSTTEQFTTEQSITEQSTTKESADNEISLNQTETVIQNFNDKEQKPIIKKIEHQNEIIEEKITVKKNNNEEIPGKKDVQSSPLLDIFCAPILFSDVGFKCYIKHRYNRRQYNDFLPLCFTDMLEFLTYGMQQSSRDYPKRIINLFHKKLKESSFVNAFAFNELLEKMPNTLNHYFPEPYKHHPKLKNDINNILYANFLQNFNDFKKDPDIFLDTVSASLATKALENILEEQDNTTQEELRGMIIRFLEHGISKLIWDPEEGENVWQSITSLARNIAEFGKQGIFIYEEDLDDLYWSLITRFGYFIELAGSQIPLQVYEKIQKDLQYDELYFLEIEEQEDYIITKKEYLLGCIKSGLAKAHAHKMGFVSEIIAA